MPPRKQYDKIFHVPLCYDEFGIAVEYEVRLDIVRGLRTGYCLALRIRDEQDRNRLKDIVRYDGDHGYLHKHAPGFPPGSPTDVPFQPGQDPVQVALADLVQNAEQYIAEARATGYEVPEDVDETDS